jgi:hypothetical protein
VPYSPSHSFLNSNQNLLKFLGKHILPPCIVIPYVYKTYFAGKPLEIVGFLYICYLLYKMVVYPLYFKLKITTWGRVNIRSYGKYAVVTGGTSGIGEAFVHTFGRKGLNVIVVSRSQDKLNRVKEEVRGIGQREKRSEMKRAVKNIFQVAYILCVPAANSSLSLRAAV